VLLAPTVAIAAPPIGEETVQLGSTEESVMAAMIRNTGPFNGTHLPALSVPCGFNAQGLPIGLQIIGRPFDEATVIQAGHAYEQATEWHLRRPSL
jgi:Asp-tRNA(Asn)/Glu-tRNA(Gln) amidotransferase A subunit family amidase